MTVENKLMDEKKKKEFDYYVYVDYSEDFIGYVIIDGKNKLLLLRKSIKFRHFKELRHKGTYLLKIKKVIEKENIYSLIYKSKISSMRNSLNIFSEVVDFVKRNAENWIFISVDNKQYISFVRLFREVFEMENIVIVKEDRLIKNSVEYKLSLIIDNFLNIERRKLI